jgi:hypothetical protein
MPTHAQTDARKLRARLNHPVIDADGHWAEWGEVNPDFFKGTVVEKQAAEVLGRDKTP